MNRKIALAGPDSKLKYALAENLLMQKDELVLAASSDPSQRIQDFGDAVTILPWNGFSLLSNKNLVLETHKKHSNLDEVIYVLDFPHKGDAFHELQAAFIEKNVQEYITSLLMFSKEWIDALLKKEKGILTFVYKDPGEIKSPVEAMVLSAFTGFVESLFTSYRNENIKIRGFFGQEILEHLPLALTEKAEKSWYRWNKLGRGSLMSMFR